MSIGDNIKKARINKKLNQIELAELLKENKVNVGNTTISNWEHGTSKPDPDTIGILCKILDVDANFLLDFTSTKEFKELEDMDLINQYKALFDKDNKLTTNQKEFMISFLQEQHKKIDEELDKK